MIAITKGMIGLAALIAGGFVSIEGLSDKRHEPTPAAVIADRYLFSTEIPMPSSPMVNLDAQHQDAVAALLALKALGAKKGDRLETTDRSNCADQTWPKISADCLVFADGQQLRRAVRFVTFERKTGQSSSELMRAPLTDVASR